MYFLILVRTAVCINILSFEYLKTAIKTKLNNKRLIKETIGLIGFPPN